MDEGGFVSGQVYSEQKNRETRGTSLAGPIGLLLLALGFFSPGRGLAAPSSAATVYATAPLGTVVTATVSLDNSGRPAMTARLYEAWQLPVAPADSTPDAPVHPLRVPLPDVPGPIAPHLLDELAKAPDGQADMLIYLADQADLSTAAATPDWNARGVAVVNTLRRHAARLQSPLLAALRRAGHAPRSYWIVNALAVRGNRALAEWAAAQPGVALVASNERHRLDPDFVVPVTASDDPVAWGVARIRAPSVWLDWGVQGEGIVVANLDTGVAYTHSVLLNGYRGWSGPSVVHDYNWYDPVGEPPSPQPEDPAGHGTHTMGTMVGRAANGLPAIGVAPAARWIAVRSCAGISCQDEALIAGAQWLLAPLDLAGANPRPDLRPHIVNNSWGKAGDDPWYAGYVAAWNAAGIFSVFANGNSGLLADCGTSHSPANYETTIGVGATDGEDFIAEFSSRGPTGDGRAKPDLSAPGVDVPSAWPGGSIQLLSGTSMAAPHVAGVVALLWSANPSLIGDIERTRELLTATAVPRTSDECGDAPDAVPNSVYGWGRLDARQAVQRARVDVPWLGVPPVVSLPADGSASVEAVFDARQVTAPGVYLARILLMRDAEITSIPVNFEVQPAPDTAQLTGRLTDRWIGAGVYGRVGVGNGPAVLTDPTGNYTFTLPYGSHPLTATATGYLTETALITLTGPAAVAITLTANLPHLEISGPPLSATLAFGESVGTPITISNDGLQPLSFTVSVPPLEWTVEDSGVPGGPLYDMSAFPPLMLADDMIYTQMLDIGFGVPIYGGVVNQLYLSSNGWVSVARPSTAEASAVCLPNDRLPAGTLAPFWADLDPSQGGVVRAGRVLSDTFVVSFEAVPPWRDPPDPDAPTYTFQLVLRADGRVQYLYGTMGALPRRWSTGVSTSGERGQRLACHRSPQALSGKLWTLRNQPLPSLWLRGDADSTTLPPASSATLTATLSGFGHVPWRSEPFAAVLRLATNVPGQSIVEVPATVVVGPAPYNHWFSMVWK